MQITQIFIVFYFHPQIILVEDYFEDPKLANIFVMVARPVIIVQAPPRPF